MNPVRHGMNCRLIISLCLLILTACDQSQWQTTPVHGLMPELTFTLTDETGQTVQAEDYAGNIRLVFFGFSHCKMACPVTLGKLTLAMKQLGPAVNDVRVLFVSVDPARDTPAVLDQYTDQYTPRMVGLTGNHEQLQDLARRYRVAYSYGDGYPGGEYMVFHSSAVFVFDRQGEIRLIMQADDGIDAIVPDLRRLLEENQT